jgi:LPXTG-motif cell wall-anchored protein
MRRQRTGIVFFAVGIAFLAIGSSGQRAFLAIGIAFLVLGLVTFARRRG